ncbi:MAG: ribonuclease P protein component [Spirochaetes bacterium]|nr:MAG: ribonuclease P protein component [Spirochaetota bacterium]
MVTQRLDFPKSEKVRAKSEIDRIFRTGTRFSCKGMVMRVAKNPQGQGKRVVFVTVRSFQGAIQRNRAKRIAREAWRLNKHRFNEGYDVAVVLYPEIADFEECSRSLLFLLRKAGLLR